MPVFNYQQYESSKLQMTQKISLIIIPALFAVLLAQAQVNNTGIQQQFDYYRKTTLAEKIYVHTDKNFYLAGEILWWKLYYVDGVFHKPIDVSKVAYVEILDAKNKPVMQAKAALLKGDGNGSFYLPVSLSSGTYTLRAYTNWMKNFGADYFFEKNITIVNSLKPLSTTSVRSQTPSYDIQFFPEGGNLVRDIQSKVAFRVTDQYGKGLNFSGALVNDNNDTVLRFQPLKFGIGQFNFTPSGTQNYKAVVQIENGPSITKALPAAFEKGYVMSLSEENNNIHVKVATNMQVPGVFLFAHTRQVIKAAANGTFSNNVTEFNIPIKQLGDGVSHFTVFDINQQPVCERLYFKKPAQKLQIESSSDAQQYTTRQKVDVSVHTPVPADMSLAIYRLDSLQTVDENSIQSYLWLTSDLKGNIESPGYYFSNNSNETREAADNLMLTHGWRRFNWDSVLRNPYTYSYIPEYDGHIVTGKVVNVVTNRPEPEIKANLSVPGIPGLYYSALSDASGNVHFDVRGYYGPGELIVMPEQKAGSRFRIDINNPFFEQYNTIPKPAFNLTEATQRTLNSSSIAMQVQNAYSSEQLSHFNLPVIDSTQFFGTHGVRYMLDDYVRFVTMEEVLREYVFEVGIRRIGGSPHLLVSDLVNKGFYSGEPLILLDGIPVTHEAILEYDPLKVKKLQVVPARYITGQFVYDGIVSFTTYDGIHEALKIDPQSVSLDYNGLQVKREFYSPVYDNPQSQSRIPDFRNVLYWSPDVRTDHTGNTSIHFYTSDVKGKYVGILQGIDAAGNAGSQVFTFEVSK
ncbi:MAG: hypothetical protein QM731_17740 [Chitinophagaceae bacterium]